MLNLKHHFREHFWAPLVLILFAFSIAFYFSGQFYFFDTPDDSLITNPAWRMVNGHVPFRDFGLIQGLTPALFEAVFMAVLGANLKALMIHVSIVNAVAALTTYFILLLVGLSRLTAFVFAALTAVIFYPPQGLAFSVQHGTLMMMIALLLAILANGSLQTFKASSGAWFSCGLAMAFAYLAKQTLGFFLPSILLLMITAAPRRLMSAVTFLSLGGSLPFLILYLTAGGDKDAAARMLHYLITMPWGFGGARLGADLNEALVVYELALTPTIVASIAITLTSTFMILKNNYANRKDRQDFFESSEYTRAIVLVAIGALWLIGNISLARIHHWDANLLLQSIFLSAGIILAGFIKLVREGVSGENSSGNLKITAIVPILCLIAIYDGWWAYANLVKHRGIRNIDSVLATRLKIAKNSLFPEIRGARFREFTQRQVAEKRINQNTIENDIDLKTKQIAFFRSLNDTFIIHGFPKIIQIFAGKVDPLPVVAIQPGASSAYRESNAFAELIRDLERNIAKFKVKGLVLTKSEFHDHKSLIEENPRIFCNFKLTELAVIINFCPSDALPEKFGYVVGRVISLDGDLYQ